MRQPDAQALKTLFLGWQCRIRQMSVRQFGGQPMPAVRPRVSSRSGELIVPAMAVLLIPTEPSTSTAFFKFQVQKTNEPEQIREAALQYLAADYFQLPELFSDEMAAVFPPQSEIAERIVGEKTIVLEFEQYSQKFRISCRARRIDASAPARESAFWQARLFNENLPKDVDVIGFKPDWKRATSEPMP
jgi:hypothetical protein